MFRRIVVLTGAGISQAAGLPTYRGPGGLWTDEKLFALSNANAFVTRREEVTNVWWGFRRKLAEIEPTVAHRALAAFADRSPGRLTLITQNVDGLHQRAGSRDVCEYHGSLARWHCEVCGTASEPPEPETPPSCCGERMRPDVVAFGEPIPAQAERTARKALAGCDLFVAIGTSGNVHPAASFVRWAEAAGAQRVLLNLDVYEGARGEFNECRAGRADELVPAFFDSLS
ncbi:MAG TPA: Sir2 family NAD-dependent protein deacetylase [Kofleriaceae bacterium]|nr:Sir2 family NAD-dependent protein deacetylase [Kofleriaceae bacterium]